MAATVKPMSDHRPPEGHYWHHLSTWRAVRDVPAGEVDALVAWPGGWVAGKLLVVRESRGFGGGLRRPVTVETEYGPVTVRSPKHLAVALPLPTVRNR